MKILFLCLLIAIIVSVSHLGAPAQAAKRKAAK